MQFSVVSIPGWGRSTSNDHAGWFHLGETGMPAAGAFFCADGGPTFDPETETARGAFEIFRPALKEAWTSSVTASSSDRLRSVLHRALARTNRELFRSGMSAPVVQEQHVSVVAGIVYHGVLAVANAGNVQLYLLRRRRFKLLTEDHSFSGSLRRRGLLGHNSAIRHPYAQLATRQLGKGRDIIPAYRMLPLEPGDLLVALTDGIGELRGAARLTRWLDDLCLRYGPNGPLFGSQLVDFLVDRLEERLAAAQTQSPDDATAMVIRPEPSTVAENDTEEDSASMPTSGGIANAGEADEHDALEGRRRFITPHPDRRRERPVTSDNSGG